jgi:hypothetical protein
MNEQTQESPSVSIGNNKKKFEVVVTQFNCFSKSFIVETSTPNQAEELIRDKVNALPIDQRKGTYDGSDLVFTIKENPKAEWGPKIWFEPTGLAITVHKTVRTDITPTEIALQKSFGVVVKRLRESMRLSQREFADLADLNQPLIGVYERGETGIRLYNFIRMAAALGKAPDDLMRAVGCEYEKLTPMQSRPEQA